MGVLGSIVQSLVLSMLHPLHHLFLCRCIALEFVGDDHPWSKALPLQQFTEKPLCRLSVSMLLQQDIQHVALRIHCSPQIVLLALNSDNHFIEMPFICNVWAFVTKLIGILLPELPAPFPNRLICHLNPAIQHHFLNVSVAQGEGVVEPDAVADDFGGETMAMVQVGLFVHGRIISDFDFSQKPSINLTIPAEDIKEIGRSLVKVRECLEYGSFDTWLRGEFGWSRRAAYNFINVYERFSCANFAQVDIAPSALYLRTGNT